jgi:hypothetical protein
MPFLAVRDTVAIRYQISGNNLVTEPNSNNLQSESEEKNYFSSFDGRNLNIPSEKQQQCGLSIKK